MEKFEPSYFAGRMQNGTASLEESQSDSSSKSKTQSLPYDPVSSFLGMCPREIKTYIPIKTHTCRNFIYNNQKVKTAQMPTNWWRDK